MSIRKILMGLFLVGITVLPFVLKRFESNPGQARLDESSKRTEVVFWHFWGGKDGEVVDDVVRRFNDSQEVYYVRAIAMPGNNLQSKLFLSVAGGDPPDLVNQDDPILADWAKRGIIQSVESFAGAEEANQVDEWMFESARRLSTYEGKLFGVCNGLDVRALYYNKTVLDGRGFVAPETIDQLDRIVAQLTPPTQELLTQYAYLPDSRRLWAWGYVFGGEFFDPQRQSPTADSKLVKESLGWMQGYSRRYGADNLAAFRQGDQSLPGTKFPLLPIREDSLVGRYTFVMDGQWRVRDINDFVDNRRKQGIASPEFGVTALPAPDGGRNNAGWVNGNFFVVPQGAKNAKGSWEFIKFWIGHTQPDEAVKTCIEGGWIPVSKVVVEHPDFQSYLGDQPLFAKFVDLASSPNQFPVPQVPGAAMFRRTVESAGYEAMMNPDESVEEILQQANARIRSHLERARRE